MTCSECNKHMRLVGAVVDYKLEGSWHVFICDEESHVIIVFHHWPVLQ